MVIYYLVVASTLLTMQVEVWPPEFGARMALKTI
jgi:hypothetical protein